MAGADRDSLAIEKIADFLRAYAVEHKGQHSGLFRGRPDQMKTGTCSSAAVP